MFNEYIQPKGNLTIIVKNSLGEIKEEKTVPNLVVTTGKNWIAGRFKDAVSGYTIPTQMTHMGIGTDTAELVANPPVVANTALVTQVQRVALSTAGGVVANNVVTYEATFNTVGNGGVAGAITEAGIFTAASAGTMLCRTKFLPVNKAADDILTIVWSVTIV